MTPETERFGTTAAGSSYDEVVVEKQLPKPSGQRVRFAAVNGDSPSTELDCLYPSSQKRRVTPLSIFFFVTPFQLWNYNSYSVGPETQYRGISLVPRGSKASSERKLLETSRITYNQVSLISSLTSITRPTSLTITS